MTSVPYWIEWAIKNKQECDRAFPGARHAPVVYGDIGRRNVDQHRVGVWLSCEEENLLHPVVEVVRICRELLDIDNYTVVYDFCSCEKCLHRFLKEPVRDHRVVYEESKKLQGNSARWLAIVRWEKHGGLSLTVVPYRCSKVPGRPIIKK